MWKNAAATAKELFFPERCLFCKKYGSFVCGDCQSLLDIFSIHRPDRGREFLTDIYSACPYENKFVQKLIRSFKYEPLCRDLEMPLAKLIVDHLALAGQNFDFSNHVIIPVPLAGKRLRWRGFNQAQAIAKQLGSIWQVSLGQNCLVRTKETRPQANLQQSRRLENIKGAFACLDNAPFKGKSAFLVDDVVTTGATMEECGKILLKNGARQVIGISVARTENS